MDGTNSITGKKLGGLEHLRQSIRDILLTPIGTRVMRRDYGSDLPRLVDAPMNRGTLLEIYAATADALGKWEPRFVLQQVVAASAQPGQVVLDLYGTYVPDGKPVTLDGVVVG